MIIRPATAAALWGREPTRTIPRLIAYVCGAMMVLLAFQSLQAEAAPPNTGAAEFNHASAANGGTATASGFSGANVPSNANDGYPATYWESGTTMGWLAVTFAGKATIDEVHAHFNTTVYPKLSLYLDTDGDANFETKVWSATNNANLDAIIPIVSRDAFGVKITIDAKVGTNKPRINEVEAYLKYDSDGDGLLNGEEATTIYYQDMRAGGMPLAIPDDGVNATSAAVSLAQFSGLPVHALANFTVDHPAPNDLSAEIGYWNGSAWNDRWVWDPGGRLNNVSITSPFDGTWITGTVSVVAYIQFLETTTAVEFRVNGVLQDTTPTIQGNDYVWGWTPPASGTYALNVTQIDTLGGRGYDEITVKADLAGPRLTWISPGSMEVVSGDVTVEAIATDDMALDLVTFDIEGSGARSLFFDTKFSKDLQTQAVLQAAPYTKMKGYQNGTTSANSDVVQMAYVFDGLTAAEATAVRDSLLTNRTGVVNKTLLTWTSTDWVTINSPYLLGLPSEIIQAVPLLQWYSSPSHPENIDVAQPAVPFWVQLAQGIASAIAQTLQWIHSGLVWLGNLVVQFVQALVNFGSWVGDLTSGDPVRVRNAVQAAQKAVAQFVDAAMRFIEDIIRKTIDFLVAPLLALLREWSGELHGIIQRIMGVGDTDEQDVLMLDNVLFNSKVAMLANAIAIGIQVAIGAITILSIVLPGAQAISAILKQVILQALKAAAEHWLASSLLTLGATAIIGALIPKDSPVWQWTSGIGTLVVALVVVLVQKIIGERLGKVTKFLDGDRYGLYITLIGFFVSVGILGSGLSGMAAVVTAWIGVVLSGVGVLISSVYNSWNDVLPMGIGFADELVTVAALGFSIGVAATTKG